MNWIIPGGSEETMNYATLLAIEILLILSDLNE
jgi:hypothetical protein